MKKTKRRNSRSNKNRRRHKTIRKKFEGGYPGETMLSVLGDKTRAVIDKVATKGFSILGYEKKKDSSVPPIINPPPPPPPSSKEEEPSQFVESIENAKENIADVMTSLTDTMNNPDNVEKTKQTLDNVAKIAGPLFDDVADKAVEVFEREGDKVAAAGVDMAVAAAQAVPGVGAVISLGKELNDVAAIVESGTRSTQEILDTVNKGVVEGVKQYEEIKNLEPPTLPSVPNVNLPSVSVPDKNVPIKLSGGGALKRLQRAGATINNRVNNSINEFLTHKKTHKNKKVRFNV